jgi:hypothetical protein
LFIFSQKFGSIPIMLSSARIFGVYLCIIRFRAQQKLAAFSEPGEAERERAKGSRRLCEAPSEAFFANALFATGKSQRSDSTRRRQSRRHAQIRRKKRTNF